MNVIFTCGGTGGHINPAIAVANMWKERYPDSKILFIGANGGMEEKLVPKAGYELKTLPGGGLSRSLSISGIKKNAKVVYNLFDSVNKCKKIKYPAERIIPGSLCKRILDVNHENRPGRFTGRFTCA